jgi:hypothetical protein
MLALLLMVAWLPPGFYGFFFDHAFSGWSVYLGSHWFSEIADRQQLNYGCAPTDMLRNAYGLAFWHAILVLCACGTVAYFAAGDAGVSRSLRVPAAVMMCGFGAILTYFDAVFALLPAPFACKTASFGESQPALADQIVRHLCYEVGISILLPILVFSLGISLRRWLVRRMKDRTALPE